MHANDAKIGEGYSSIGYIICFCEITGRADRVWFAHFLLFSLRIG